LGLAAVHQEGIVHRDLKPGNILLDASGEPLLADFGLARLEAGAEHLTPDGAVVGTPAYMAPEQAAGETTLVGPASDLSSLAAVLFQMLTGRLPFCAPMPAILWEIQHTTPPPPSALLADLDPALDALVLRAIARRPQDRYGDAHQFASALESWLSAHKGVPSPLPVAAEPTPLKVDRDPSVARAPDEMADHGPGRWWRKPRAVLVALAVVWLARRGA